MKVKGENEKVGLKLHVQKTKIMASGDGQGGVACCDSWGCRVGHDWATELN